ncbi:hypothetical protein OOJ91_11930 [Micromonospora lupini]|uniref:hypothetical protein n=1 Tax=Micromonospora lupini TaxID=285679 RepID=UPI00224D6B55|nr:hypothetical protein [Micromonospora lupini]MCX5066586.1 hypothetical protein [Micromonospora lupini]
MPERSRHHQQIGSMGGLTRAALKTNEDGRKAAAQAARMRRYDAKVPAHITDPVERAQAADLLMRADMKNLGRLSGLARSKGGSQPRTPKANTGGQAA